MEMDIDYNYVFKIIIIGDSSVGKSSLINTFVHEDFNKEYISTIGVDFGVRTIDFGDLRIKLQIWDTAGQEVFRSITRSYYKGAIGCLLVFDVTNKDSFKNIDTWMKDVMNVRTEHKTTFLLVGNKCDLVEKREIWTEDLQKLKKVPYVETTNYSSETVFNAFYTLTTLIFDNLNLNDINQYGCGVKKNKVINKPKKSSYCC